MAAEDRVEREVLAGTLLCLAAGGADALGYLASGVFAANMTGNTVLASMAVAEGDFALAAQRLGTLATFLAGAMLARLVLRRRAPGIAWALGIECALLVVASWVDLRTAEGAHLLCVAMGVQAAAMTRFAGAAMSTVVVTSTLARLGESLLDYLAMGIRPQTAFPPPQHVGLFALGWSCYALGAAAAALASWIAPVSVVPPLLFVAALVAIVALIISCKPSRLGPRKACTET